MTLFIMTLLKLTDENMYSQHTQVLYQRYVSYIGHLGNFSTPEFKGQIISLLTDFSYLTIIAKCRDRTWNFETTRPVRYTLAFRI